MKKKATITKSKAAPKANTFPVVAIGASAGGLEAVTALLSKLSPVTGMAYIYIQHLDPTHKSLLSSLLSKVTKMKVQEAKNLTLVKPDQLFIIPPNKEMTLENGVLHLRPRNKNVAIHLPIDKFFSSIADRQREGAIGILLSGNGSDGTFGLKSIKTGGGITFAQDKSAKFQSMPKSAIAEGVVDMILSPEDIAKELERISDQISQNIEITTSNNSNVRTKNDSKSVINIIQLLRKATGTNFSGYKTKMISRRIFRRMLLYKISTFEDYYKYLLLHTNEIKVLYEDMLIHVTSFFRDASSVEILQRKIIPKIFSVKNAEEPIRVWVPACSTGEEAYSLAILLLEAAEKKPQRSIQVFATDLSESAIAKARLGLFSAADLQNVSAIRIQNYFEKIDGSYRIIKRVRQMCVFAVHNVFKDPPFSRIDIVSCCNLMIYLESELQKKVLSLFHYALTANGYLVIGKAESTGNTPALFSSVDKKYKIFSRKNASSGLNMARLNFKESGIETQTGKRNNEKRKERQSQSEDFNNLESKIDEIFLSRFMPAAVLINMDFEILQFRGLTELFLGHQQGKASLNLLKLAKPSLVFEIRSLVHKTSSTGKVSIKPDVDLKKDDKIHMVTIEAIPLFSDEEQKLFLIIFREQQVSHAAPAPGESRDKHFNELQEKLVSAREDMRFMLEEQEANVENLQSANEEILSSNEELQSINEELETTKEEVESTNEELLTINNELEIRNEQLAESQEYAETVFETIQEAILILDHEFRIKKANASFYKLFRVSAIETEGMLLFEIGNRQWNILKLRELLEKIVNQRREFRDFEMRHDFPQIGKKIMLLNASPVRQKISSRSNVVLTIADITKYKK